MHPTITAEKKVLISILYTKQTSFFATESTRTFVLILTIFFFDMTIYNTRHGVFVGLFTYLYIHQCYDVFSYTWRIKYEKKKKC